MTGDTDPASTLPAPSDWVDPLDAKVISVFPGRVVRKDLGAKVKVGDNIPVYVLEYLLGKYCSSTDEKEIANGIKAVKDTIAEKVVRADQTELLKAKLAREGSRKIIDHVTVTFDEKVQGGKYWARLTTAGLSEVNIDEALVHQHQRLLTGGVWANVELTYDDTMETDKGTRPFVIHRLAPIQIASARFDEFCLARQQFSRSEWVDLMLRTMGYEPTNGEFTWRRKMLYLLRLVPLVQKNYNLIELGPRETGKSFVYRELSPHALLLSGGQGSVADLFGYKGRKNSVGKVSRYDLVAFDEVAGSHFKADSDRTMYQGYMEQGSFARGDDRGTVSAEAGIVFNGNIDGDVTALARSSHLFTPLPESLRNASAFHDRWHCYLPGWEIPKLRPEFFTKHLGFVADYVAEIFHNELRPLNYTDLAEQWFAFGNHVGGRDRKAALRTVSGLLKLIHPDGACTKEEMSEYVDIALEMRRRVKEQLKRIDPIEFAKVSLSYIDRETGAETIPVCPELGVLRLIPEEPQAPGDVFTIGCTTQGERQVLYRIQVQALAGNGAFKVMGISDKAIKESARMAFDYLRANGRKIGLDRDLNAYEFTMQVMSPMQGGETTDLGVAQFVALYSAVSDRRINGGLVILGSMTIHGVLNRVDKLGERLRIALDSGAKQVMIPVVNAADIPAIPGELLDKLRIDFYSDPSQAAFKSVVGA